MLFFYETLAAAYAQAGKLDEAQDALVEARRLNPKLMVKWEIEHGPGIPAVLEGLRKAGLPEEWTTHGYAPAMIDLRNATWREKAALPCVLALTVVRGLRPTKALVTST